ncbi:hypothetical protein D3C80_2170500 [compost metagenome]
MIPRLPSDPLHNELFRLTAFLNHYIIIRVSLLFVKIFDPDQARMIGHSQLLALQNEWRAF